jgi:hypothetical protein
MDDELEMDRLSRLLAAEQEDQPIQHFNYRSVANDLEGVVQPILTAIGTTKLGELEAYEKGLVHVLSLAVVINTATWHTIRFLTWEFPPQIGWQREFVYAVPPLGRTLLDSLCNIIFMFDDPGANVHWFLVSGWSDQYRSYKRQEEKCREKPGWGSETWLKALAAEFNQTEKFLVKLTDEERAKPDKPFKERWPGPGRMAQYPMKDEDRKKFLDHVNAWFYKGLSSDSHLTLTGLLNRGGHHLPLAAAIDPDDMYQRKKFHFIGVCLIGYLAILSEVSYQLALVEEKAKLRDVWKKAVVWPDAADLWTMRYDALLK